MRALVVGLPPEAAYRHWRDDFDWSFRDEVAAVGTETSVLLQDLLFQLLYKAHFGRNSPRHAPFQIVHPGRPGYKPEPDELPVYGDDAVQAVDQGSLMRAFAGVSK